MKKQLFTLLMLLMATVTFAQYRISTEGTSKTFTIQDLGNPNDYGESFSRAAVFGDKISDTRVRIKIHIENYNPRYLIKNQGVEYSEFRDGNNSDATFASAEAVDAWFKENTGFKTASGGSEATTDASDLTSGTLADARVAETNVTQYEDALEIGLDQVSNKDDFDSTVTVTVSNTNDSELTESHLIEDGFNDFSVLGGFTVESERVSLDAIRTISSSVLTGGTDGGNFKLTTGTYRFKVSEKFAIRLDGGTQWLTNTKIKVNGVFYDIVNNGSADGIRYVIVDLGEVGISYVEVITEDSYFVGYYTKPNAVAESWDYDDSVIFFGDSVTEGWLSTWNGYSYPFSIFPDNVNVVSSGAAGTGYVDPESQINLRDRIITDYTGIVSETNIPSVVIIAMGYNDWGWVGGNPANLATFKQAISDTYDNLRSVYDGVVYVVTPWNPLGSTGTPDSDWEDIHSAVLEEVSDNRGFYLIDVKNLDYDKSDYIHPTDLGHSQISDYLKKYLLSNKKENLKSVVESHNYKSNIIEASTVNKASLRIPHGVAPTTPNDGDIWTTSTGVFVRVNGVTYKLDATAE